MTIREYEKAAEAILFTMGDSVSAKSLAAALELSESDTRKIVQNLMDRYQELDSGIQIIELEDAWQMCTRPELYDYLIRIAKQPRKYALTDVVLETLSIIAYKQPVTRQEIEKIRGVSCSHAVNKLLDYGLIRELGRLDAPGKPILFGTTEEFLRCFAVRSADDLPSISQDKIEEIREEATKEAQIPVEV